MATRQDLDPTHMTCVVLVGKRAIDDRTWRCNTEEEAKSLVSWLEDNGISSSRMSPATQEFYASKGK
jgi:hypothetical protein